MLAVADTMSGLKKLFGNTTCIRKICHVAKNMGVQNFTHVYKYQYKEIVFYKAHIPRFKWVKYFDDEKEAAIAADKKLLEKGEPPVNILKRKCN